MPETPIVRALLAALVLASGVVVPCGLSGCEVLAGVEDRTFVPEAGSGPGSVPVIDASLESSTLLRDASAGAATSETAPPDAATPEAATPEAAAEARAADLGVPCSQQPSYLFCDDFDSMATAATGWDWTFENLDGGMAQLDHDALTPPNDLQVIIPPGTGGVQLGESLGTLTAFTLSFDLRLDVDSLDDLPQTIIAQVLVTSGDGGTNDFNYILGPGSNRFLELENGSFLDITLPTMPLHQWVHLSVSYSPATGVSTSQDGQVIGANAAYSIPPGTGTLIVGDVFSKPPGTATLTFSMDDVVVQGSVPSDD
jgi:hypothetical protein